MAITPSNTTKKLLSKNLYLCSIDNVIYSWIFPDLLAKDWCPQVMTEVGGLKNKICSLHMPVTLSTYNDVFHILHYNLSTYLECFFFTDPLRNMPIFLSLKSWRNLRVRICLSSPLHIDYIYSNNHVKKVSGFTWFFGLPKVETIKNLLQIIRFCFILFLSSFWCCFWIEKRTEKKTKNNRKTLPWATLLWLMYISNRRSSENRFLQKSVQVSRFRGFGVFCRFFGFFR